MKTLETIFSLNELRDIEYERLIRHIHRCDLADILHATPRQVRWAEANRYFFDSRIQQRFENFLKEFPVIDEKFYEKFMKLKTRHGLTLDQIVYLGDSTNRIVSDMHRGSLGPWSGRRAMDVMMALENYQK